LDISSEIDYYYLFGSKGEKVHFTSKEVKQIKNCGPAGLTLLGFRPREDLKPKFSMKSSAFIVPDETQFTGSCSLFAHFLERIQVQKKVAFCKFISRNGSVAKLVALIPQVAAFDQKFDGAIPEGFHMVYLPFADDLRSITHPDFEIPKDTHVEYAHKIIATLNDPGFVIGSIKNPGMYIF
jgi:ATP-dependent DNA helicase 2 subunit 1